ncbi:MAG: hypothetical protein C5B53_12375 [Candidatus Melainabacteria bacterium]|nr:MAG: hypothetical protein C5B53_12375 [Candidatus Melainabacteria bacterium]
MYSTSLSLKLLSKKTRVAGLVSIVLVANFLCQNGAFAQSSALEVSPAAPIQAPAPQQAPQENGDATIKNFQPGQEPVVVPPITFVDVNAGRFGKLEIDLTDGQFLDTAVDKLHLIAKDLDVKEGVLKSLDIAIQGGHLQDFIFDQLRVVTAGDLKFDPGIFLNHHMLQFSEPAQAEVTATISQTSLNSFLNSPRTLQKLSVKAGNKVAAIASLVGVSSGNIGLNIAQADVALKKGNKVAVDFQSNLGLGQMGLPLNGQIEGTLGLKDGWLDISDPHLATGGQQLSPELSGVLLKKIGGISTSAQKSEDIRFVFTDLKVVANKQIQLKGTAQISRLRFGKTI